MNMELPLVCTQSVFLELTGPPGTREFLLALLEQ
jgi:hypothetical protein